MKRLIKALPLLLIIAICSNCAAVGSNSKINEVNIPSNSQRGSGGDPNNSNLSTNGILNTNNILFFGDTSIDKAPQILEIINKKVDLKDAQNIIDPKESDSAKKN